MTTPSNSIGSPPQPAAEQAPRPAASGRRAAPGTTFASLRIRNFRLLAAGGLVSTTGMWMQRIAQDWLIYTLTHSATAVGLATALQCLPTLLFGVWGGGVADRFPKRRVLLMTQVMLASLAGVLALLALVHTVAPWNVYLIALLLGMVSVVGNPAGQSFVVELVGPDQLRNAISINSSVFQLGGFVGPALAGITINALGVGYAFALNALSYLGPIVALVLIRESELIAPAARRTVQDPEVLIRRIVSRPEISTPLLVVAVMGLFAPNLPVTLAVLARVGLHGGAGLYGVLGAVVAAGSVLGALYSARQPAPRMRTFFGYGGLVMTAYLLAAAAPDEAWLIPALLGVGAATVLLITSANSMIQLNTPRGAQGRVMGLYSLVVFGGATVGGPLLGLFDQAFGPRSGLVIAAVVPGLAVLALLRRPWCSVPRNRSTSPTGTALNVASLSALPGRSTRGGRMSQVFELAEFRIVDGRAEEFERVMELARTVIARDPGLDSIEYWRGIERTDVFVLLLKWKSLEAHLEGWRNSPHYPNWSALVAPFIAEVPGDGHFVPCGEPFSG